MRIESELLKKKKTWTYSTKKKQTKHLKKETTDIQYIIWRIGDWKLKMKRAAISAGRLREEK